VGAQQADIGEHVRVELAHGADGAAVGDEAG
jgi:hypothetical protein